jgi:hypothetical protein
MLKPILIVFFHLHVRLPSILFGLQDSHPKYCVRLTFPTYTPHAPPTSFSLTWSQEQYLAWSKNYDEYFSSVVSFLLPFLS